MQNFVAAGTGTGLDKTSACPSGTPTGVDCFALTGYLHGAPIGQATFTANLNVVTTATPIGNGSGGTCSPASGTMMITFGRKGANSLSLGFDGVQCDVDAAPTAPAVGPTVLTGSFYVLGGSGGKFADLNGKSGPGEGGAGLGSLTLGGDDALAVLSGSLEFSPAPK